MNDQILKKCQQKELNLMHVTCKKTRNYIFFFAAWEAARKLNKQKWAIFFTSEDKTKPNTTEFPFFYYNGWHIRKHQKKKANNTRKTNSKRGNRKMFSAPDETIPCSERKMKVVRQKTTKTRQLFWDKSFFNSLSLVPT